MANAHVCKMYLEYLGLCANHEYKEIKRNSPKC